MAWSPSASGFSHSVRACGRRAGRTASGRPADSGGQQARQQAGQQAGQQARRERRQAGQVAIIRVPRAEGMRWASKVR